MSILNPRSFALLLVLSVLSLFCLTCRPAEKAPPPPPPKRCTVGNGLKDKPLICVDENKLTASPHSAHVWDVEPDTQKPPHPSNRPVIIHWLSQRPANLQIKWQKDDCAEPVQCDGKGACSARVKMIPRPGPKVKPDFRQCGYDISLAGKKLDPPDDIVVDPCCW